MLTSTTVNYILMAFELLVINPSVSLVVSVNIYRPLTDEVCLPTLIPKEPMQCALKKSLKATEMDNESPMILQRLRGARKSRTNQFCSLLCTNSPHISPTSCNTTGTDSVRTLLEVSNVCKGCQSTNRNRTNMQALETPTCPSFLKYMPPSSSSTTFLVVRFNYYCHILIL